MLDVCVMAGCYVACQRNHWESMGGAGVGSIYGVHLGGKSRRKGKGIQYTVNLLLFSRQIKVWLKLYKIVQDLFAHDACEEA